MSALSWPILDQMTGGSSGEHHLDLKPVDTSKTEAALREAVTTCQLAIQKIPQEVEVSQELLRDAGAITERDMQELQPEKFLGNHIVDFYIKFLERRLPPEHGKLFYFFNSFFFTKLFEKSASTGKNSWEVDYKQLRRWTKEVNLFEKDYVFIPIVESSHWSLVILCNLTSLTCAPDEKPRFPCIVHLDPIKGKHKSFKGLIRSYVWEAWMDKFQASIDGDQLLHGVRALYRMKYIQAEVPQQDNSYDCGLYVLHYIEAFLVESTSSDFSFALSERGPRFAHSHFLVEVLSKRKHIQNLILKLGGIFQERAKKHKAIEDHAEGLMQTSQKLLACLEDAGNSEDVLTAHPTIFNGQGCEINHASTVEDTMYAQHQQSSGMSRGNNEPSSDPEIGPTEYENRCESLSPKQQYAKIEVQTISLTNFKSRISETKHASTQEDTIDVQHQQSSRISKLDYGLLDGPELLHVENEQVDESFLDKHRHLQLEEVPCIDLSEVRKGKNKRAMKEEETSVLLSCKLEGGRFCKGSGGATHWNFISEEIGEKLGSSLSALQCRRRYETLFKAYKTYNDCCTRDSKTFSEITEKERLSFKAATTLSEEWYRIMDEICNQANTSQKCVKLSSKVCNNLRPLSSPAPNRPPLSLGRSLKDEAATLDSVFGTVEVPLCNVFPASVLSSLDKDLQCTLLNLVQECSIWLRYQNVRNGKRFDLGAIYRRLAILQDREPSEILNYVFKLWQLELVNVVDMVFEEGKDFTRIDLWKGKTWYLKSVVYDLISQEVLCKNLHLKTYCKSFPIEQSSLQYIRVLRLVECGKLKHLELGEFPNLRSLTIHSCPKLNLVTGWEVATGLGSLEIRWCNAYLDFPKVQYLFSLREFFIFSQKSNDPFIPWQFSEFSQCSKLRKLEIWSDKSWSGRADLENLKELKVLEFLSLGCIPFPSIRGLSGLQALTTLDLRYCSCLKSVPELGCLKGLTHLDMRFSGIEDVEGVGELHSLIYLGLFGCASLKQLPFLGHLKALVFLNLSGTGVKVIPGLEKLISLDDLIL